MLHGIVLSILVVSSLFWKEKAVADVVLYTAEDVKFAIVLAPELVPGSPPASLLDCIVKAETGNTYSPYALGDGGTSHGAVQLNERGLLPLANSLGVDAYNPYEAVGFLAHAIANGLGYHWTTFRGCT